MPKQPTNWNKIVPGDIISFQYKSRVSDKPLRTHSIMVLNPKFPKKLKGGVQKFYINGLKLEGSNISIFTNKVEAWDMLKSVGWVSIKSLKDEIYKIDIPDKYVRTYGATEKLYKELRQTPIGKKAEFRSYEWSSAIQKACYYEPIKLPKDKIELLIEQRDARGM